MDFVRLVQLGSNDSFASCSFNVTALRSFAVVGRLRSLCFRFFLQNAGSYELTTPRQLFCRKNWDKIICFTTLKYYFLTINYYKLTPFYGKSEFGLC